MHYYLLVGACLFFAFMVPVQTTATFVGVVLLVSLVAKATAQAIGNVEITMTQSYRAVAFSLAFVGIALFTLGSFTVGNGITQFTGAAAFAVLGGLFLAYALGFMVILGTTLGAGSGVAAVSTLSSGLLLWLAKDRLRLRSGANGHAQVLRHLAHRGQGQICRSDAQFFVDDASPCTPHRAPLPSPRLPSPAWHCSSPCSDV